MFRIKICGVTTSDDALAAIDAGADAIGLNFYPRSPRALTAEQAASISATIGGRAIKVGVFVNRPAHEIVKIAAECGLDMVQLHGDEPPAVVSVLAPLGVLRAFRDSHDLAAARAYLDDCAARRALPRMVLFDGAAPGQFGGTGHTADWAALAGGAAAMYGLPWVLAGGLHPGNVGAAMAATRPSAVDVASGVESRPGVKCREKMAEFVRAARAAFGLPG